MRGIVGLVSCAAALAGGRVAAEWMRGEDGSPAALFAACDEPLAAVAATLVAISFAIALGSALHQWLGMRAGPWTLALCLLGFAARAGGAESLIRTDGNFWQVAAESMAWSAMLLLAWWLTKRGISHPQSEQRHTQIEFGRRHGWLLGCAAMPPIIWLLARSELKGQTLAAACIASVTAGFIAHVLMHRPRGSLFAAIPLLGGALWGLATLFGGPLDATQIPGGLSPFQLVMPVDYVAGAWLGGLVGMAWANSIMHEAPPAGRAAVAPIRGAS